MKYDHIGKVIKMLREEYKYTQEELAEIAGVTPRTIQRVESGDECSGFTFAQLAVSFQLSEEELHSYCKIYGVAEEAIKEYEATPPEDRLMPTFCDRQTEGATLVRMATSTLATMNDHGNLETTEEAEAVGEFLQGLMDYREVWSDVPMQDRIEIELMYTDRLKKLDEMGFLVYATTTEQSIEFLGGYTSVDAVVILVIRKNNPLVTGCPDQIPTLLPSRAKVF